VESGIPDFAGEAAGRLPDLCDPSDRTSCVELLGAVRQKFSQDTAVRASADAALKRLQQ
jgi:hypothetical protein